MSREWDAKAYNRRENTITIQLKMLDLHPLRMGLKMGLFKNNKKKETVEEAFETPCRPPSRNRPRPNRDPRPDELDFHVEMVQKIDNLLKENTTETQPVVTLRSNHNRPKQPSALSAPQPLEFTASIPDGTTAPFRFCTDFEHIETPFAPSQDDRVEVIDLNSIMNVSDTNQPATASKKIHFNFPNKNQTDKKETTHNTDEATTSYTQEQNNDTMDAEAIKSAEKQRKIEEKRRKAQEKKQAQEVKKAQKAQEKMQKSSPPTTAETKPGFFSNIFSKKDKTTETPMPEPRPLSPNQPKKPYDRTYPAPPPQRPLNEIKPDTNEFKEVETTIPSTEPAQQINAETEVEIKKETKSEMSPQYTAPQKDDSQKTETAYQQTPEYKPDYNMQKQEENTQTTPPEPTPTKHSMPKQQKPETNPQESMPIEPTPTIDADLIKDEDVKYVLLRTDELLGNLPQNIIEEFAQSDDFKVYSKVMKKIKEAQH